jgi:hypothetical protein
MTTPFSQADFAGPTRSLNIFQSSAAPPFETLTSPENINAVNYSGQGLKCTNAVGLGQCYWAASEINMVDLYDNTFSVWGAGCSSADTFPETNEIRINTTVAHAGGIKFEADYTVSKVRVTINPLHASESVAYTFKDMSDVAISDGTIFLSDVIGDMNQLQFGYSFDVVTGIFTFNADNVDFLQVKLASVVSAKAISHWGTAFGDEPGHGFQDIRSYNIVADMTKVITATDDFHDEFIAPTQSSSFAKIALLFNGA